MYSYAYFMAGRVEDAWRMQERKPRENYRRQDCIWRAMLLAVVGRTDDAPRPWRTRLPISPGVSIESYARRPDLKNVPGIKQLPECEAERAKAAAMRS